MKLEQIEALIKEKEDLIYQFKQEDNADYRDILAGRLTDFQAQKRRGERDKQIQALENEIATLKSGIAQDQLIGWVEIGQNHFAQVNQTVNSESINKYFDGGFPSWDLIVSKVIPRRKQVHKLLEHLHTISETADLPITLLTGPSGEGKSTAIRQVIHELVQDQHNWRILWREPEKIEFTSIEKVVEYVLTFPVSDTLWLISSDEAKVLFGRLSVAVDKVREANRTDVLFLLSCRGIDWQTSVVKNRLYSLSREIPMIGLDREDASNIVKAWKDNKTLQTLENFSAEIAVQKLYDAARGGSSYESFLGAMLTVRIGKNLRRFVTSMISQLADLQERTGRKLLDAFIYIAVIHALNLRKGLLTDSVLAGVLRISPEEIHQIIVALGREAAATLEGDYIVTRHIKIAQEAVQILNSDYEGLADKRLVTINKIAVKGFVLRTFSNSEIGRWNYLSKEVFKQNNANSKELGIRLAKAVCEADPKDAYLVVNLASLYRLSNHSQEAIQLLQSQGKQVKRVHRAYYYEWATNEGISGNLAMDVYLSAISVSDQVPEELTAASAKMSLAGISKAFYSLFQKATSTESAQLLRMAAWSAVQIGLPLPVGERATDETNVQLSKMRDQLAGMQPDDIPSKDLLNHFASGAVSVSKQLPTDLGEWVPKAQALRFTKLYSVFKEYSQTKSSSYDSPS